MCEWSLKKNLKQIQKDKWRLFWHISKSELNVLRICWAPGASADRTDSARSQDISAGCDQLDTVLCSLRSLCSQKQADREWLWSEWTFEWTAHRLRGSRCGGSRLLELAPPETAILVVDNEVVAAASAL